MSRKFLLFSLLLIFILSSITVAQKRHKRDWDDWDDFDDIAWVNVNAHATPMIEITYGPSKFKQKLFDGDFSKTASLEFKIGYSDTWEHYEEYLVERDDHFLFASYHSSDLVSDKPLLTEFDFDVWQFGLGKREGYGFNLDPVLVIPYTQSSLVWNLLKKDQIPGMPVTQDTLAMNAYLSDIDILDRYNEAIRFGTDYEAGLRVNIASFLDVSGGFQFGTVYPRYMVWKQLGSFAIETAGVALLDEFISEIMDSSPAAGPLMNVLLKGAYNYAFYTLKKERMNWPFETEKPLTYETFKFGVTLTF